MVTHRDVDLSLYQFIMVSDHSAFKQKVFVAFTPGVLYRNDHSPIQVLPRWISICILELTKATQLNQAVPADNSLKLQF